MNVRGLISFFEERRQASQPMVLVTVFETRGSTYSKAGAQMLLDGNGDFHGMLSGGCLEGDLVARAASVIESGMPQQVTYDLAQDDELWGLGVGCDGLMRVLLQPLSADSDYQPFTAIAGGLAGDEDFRIRIVVESENDALPAGASVVEGANGTFRFGVGADVGRQVEDVGRRSRFRRAGGEQEAGGEKDEPGSSHEPALRIRGAIRVNCTPSSSLRTGRERSYLPGCR